MKYIITRQFSFTNEVFEIINDLKTIYTAKATSSKQYKGQFNLKLSNIMNELVCTVEPDEKNSHNYLISSIDDETNKKYLFGELHYEICNYDNYLYTIIIGHKLYKVRSSDLKDRRLSIIDLIQSNTNEVTRLDCPQTLYQVIDSFSKSNKKYHVHIHDKEWPLGYIAITILLHLHESQRSLMIRRYASINDLPIKEEERKFRWPLGQRQNEHPGLTDLDL